MMLLCTQSAEKALLIFADLRPISMFTATVSTTPPANSSFAGRAIVSAAKKDAVSDMDTRIRTENWITRSMEL